MDIKYPNVTVILTGQDGNAFNILGLALRALRKENVSLEERNAFKEEATKGDYDHLLQTTMKWMVVD